MHKLDDIKTILRLPDANFLKTFLRIGSALAPLKRISDYSIERPADAPNLSNQSNLPHFL